MSHRPSYDAASRKILIDLHQGLVLALPTWLMVSLRIGSGAGNRTGWRRQLASAMPITAFPPRLSASRSRSRCEIETNEGEQVGTTDP